MLQRINQSCFISRLRINTLVQMILYIFNLDINNIAIMNVKYYIYTCMHSNQYSYTVPHACRNECMYVYIYIYIHTYICIYVYITGKDGYTIELSRTFLIDLSHCIHASEHHDPVTLGFPNHLPHVLSRVLHGCWQKLE